MVDGKIKKQRQSNIELCRIVSIFLIVLLHSTWSSIGYPEKGQAIHPLVIAIYSLSIIGVDVFLFISGWFSIHISKKSIMNLLFICLFYGLARVLLLCYQGRFSLEDLLFVSKSNWFVVSYIGLMIISPVLNSFIEQSPKKVLGG